MHDSRDRMRSYDAIVCITDACKTVSVSVVSKHGERRLRVPPEEIPSGSIFPNCLAASSAILASVATAASVSPAATTHRTKV